MVVLIDADHLVSRCYHAMNDYRGSNGESAGAVYGFIISLNRICHELIPHYLVICWGDKRSNLWRRREHAPYKAHRDQAPDDFITQVTSIKAILQSAGIPQVLCSGYEADDVIGSISQESFKAGINVSIVSADHDLFQLIHDGRPYVNVVIPTQGGYRKITGADVVEKYGVSVAELPRLLAMVGERGDGIAGIEGIGKKRAAAYIRGEATERIKNVIESPENQVLMAHNLSLIDLTRIGPTELPASELPLEHGPFDSVKIMAELMKMGLMGKQSLMPILHTIFTTYAGIRATKAVSLDDLMEVADGKT